MRRAVDDQYDILPVPFRNQVSQIWDDAIGIYITSDYFTKPAPSNVFWEVIHDILAKEMGEQYLGIDSRGAAVSPRDRCRYHPGER